jgi:PAS domain S-box-containing protein
LVENLPIGVYTCDLDGLVVQYNRRVTEFWGRAPALLDPNYRFGGSSRIRSVDGRAMRADESPMAHVLATGRPVHNREMIVEMEDGQTLTILANIDPIHDDHGTLVGAVNCFQDVTELARARIQLREDRHVGRSFMQAIPAAMYTTDAGGKLLSFNKAAEKLWGAAPQGDGALFCGAHKVFDAAGKPLEADAYPMAVALREKHAQVGPEMIIGRADGSRIHVMPYPTPIFGSNGELLGGMNMLIDLTAQKRADAQQRGLIDELNHRVKNTLATIQSLAAQTMRGAAPSPGAKDFEDRLLALSRVHDQLTRNAWEWADLGAIASDAFARCRGSANSAIHLEGPAVRLKPRAALALGMVLHEMACNATAHGALSTAAGNVTLRWHTEDGKLLVDWRENGGPVVTAPRKRGFGTRLLERSVGQELCGKPSIEFPPSGVHCTMEIPLPE